MTNILGSNLHYFRNICLAGNGLWLQHIFWLVSLPSVPNRSCQMEAKAWVVLDVFLLMREFLGSH